MKWKIPSGSTVFTHQLSSAFSSVGYFSFLYALHCFWLLKAYLSVLLCKASETHGKLIILMKQLP